MCVGIGVEVDVDVGVCVSVSVQAGEHGEEVLLFPHSDTCCWYKTPLYVRLT